MATAIDSRPLGPPPDPGGPSRGSTEGPPRLRGERPGSERVPKTIRDGGRRTLVREYRAGVGRRLHPNEQTATALRATARLTEELAGGLDARAAAGAAEANRGVHPRTSKGGVEARGAGQRRGPARRVGWPRSGFAPGGSRGGGRARDATATYLLRRQHGARRGPSTGPAAGARPGGGDNGVRASPSGDGRTPRPAHRGVTTNLLGLRFLFPSRQSVKTTGRPGPCSFAFRAGRGIIALQAHSLRTF
jgi:hypothetical protein